MTALVRPCQAVGPRPGARSICRSSTTDVPSVPAPYRLQLTPAEKMKPAPTIVMQAEMAMNDYCATLRPGTVECEECWLAHQYFRSQKDKYGADAFVCPDMSAITDAAIVIGKRPRAARCGQVEAQSSCSLEERHGMHHGPGCSSLDRFEDLVRRLYGQVSVRNLVGAMSSLRKLADAALAKRESGGVTESMDDELQAKHVAGLPADSRNQLIQLFRGMDRNADGRLDVGEFRAAMDQLGDTLSGDSIGVILDAMQVQLGTITLDQFLTIVEAEGMVAHTPLNNWLQRSARKDLEAMRGNYS